MSVKKYKIVNQNTRIDCKTRVAYIGDTVSSDEVLRPSILESLVIVGKIEEVKSAPKTTKKTVSKPKDKSISEKPDKSTDSFKSRDDKDSNKKASKKKPK